ncbi:TPA: GNAT family N-acetyltransferase [Candidatus Woesearchaeota archaeon]|nr:GNAT family N-acetyltransferase [Candidatus Woesearchaeota archaeon]
MAFPPVMRYSAAKIGSRLRREYDGISFRRDYFVATQDTRIVGYGEVAIQSPSVALFGATATVAKEIGALDDRVGALISLGVHPDHAGRGIGRSLVLRRLEHLTAYNIRQVFTHAWSAGGFPHLARSTGFTLIKGWNGAMHPDGTTPTLYYRDLAANPLGNTAQQSRRMGLHKATNGRKTDIASNDDEQ